jgi:quercetin dioxygenase-like cupin family protein
MSSSNALKLLKITFSTSTLRHQFYETSPSNTHYICNSYQFLIQIHFCRLISDELSMKKTSHSLLPSLLTLALLLGSTKADPHPLQDYCIADTSKPFYLNGAPCIDPKLAASSHFTTAALSKPGNTKATPYGFSVKVTNVTNLPGLNTMGLTMARVDLDPNGLVPLHSHPRASEVTICIKCSLLVGFVNTSNYVFTQLLRPGESFVFPRGLIHFLYNMETMDSALAVSGLSSQSPGTQIAAFAAFTSKPSMPDEVLKKSFQISNQDVTRIRRNLGG